MQLARGRDSSAGGTHLREGRVRRRAGCGGGAPRSTDYYTSLSRNPLEVAADLKVCHVSGYCAALVIQVHHVTHARLITPRAKPLYVVPRQPTPHDFMQPQAEPTGRHKAPLSLVPWSEGTAAKWKRAGLTRLHGGRGVQHHARTAHRTRVTCQQPLVQTRVMEHVAARRRTGGASLKSLVADRALHGFALKLHASPILFIQYMTCFFREGLTRWRVGCWGEAPPIRTLPILTKITHITRSIYSF